MPRYSKNAPQLGAADDGAREEIVTGIPATAETPVGSTQFDAVEEHAKDAADNATNPLGATFEPIENRDQRGNDDGKSRLPIHEIERLADESARGYSNGLTNVKATASDDKLTVTVTTVDGTSTASADVDKWTEAGVNKALKDIERQIKGEKSDSKPEDKLADAVREVAKS